KIEGNNIKKFYRESILVVDFGSQFTQLIARRVREHKVYCEIVPYNNVDSYIEKNEPKGIILSGGPSSVIVSDTPTISKKIINSGAPILAICYGQQSLVKLLGGEVVSSGKSEFGRAKVRIKQTCMLTKNVWQIENEYQVWMSHGDSISKIPDGFFVVAETKDTPFALIANEEKKYYGVQFHPEVIHTLEGKQLIKNFLQDISGCKQSWSMSSFLDYKTSLIKGHIGNKNVVCGLSGGVDSSVTAALIDRAVGGQLFCVFVDH
ncbi:uncharacterized protein METZ01_LOCUS437732, partial [marine metagenome]